MMRLWGILKTLPLSLFMATKTRDFFLFAAIKNSCFSSLSYKTIKVLCKKNELSIIKWYPSLHVDTLVIAISTFLPLIIFSPHFVVLSAYCFIVRLALYIHLLGSFSLLFFVLVQEKKHWDGDSAKWLVAAPSPRQ